MFHLQNTIDMIVEAAAPESILAHGDQSPLFEIYEALQSIVFDLAFERSDVGSYFAQIPELWSSQNSEGNLEDALKLAFRKSVLDRALKAGVYKIRGTNDFERLVFKELDEAVSFLTKEAESFSYVKGAKTISEAFAQAGGPLYRPERLLRTYSKRSREPEQSMDDVRGLVNAISEVDRGLEASSLPRSRKDLLDAAIYHRGCLSVVQAFARLIVDGEIAMPPITMPSRFSSVATQPFKSAHAIWLESGKAFLKAFEDNYGMTPIEFVAARESLKVHYRLMNPGIMQVLFDHFGLKRQAWEDGFDIVSRNAKSGLRAQKQFKFDIIPKSSLDPLVKKTFGKSQGLHNHRHEPDFKGPTRKWKRR